MADKEIKLLNNVVKKGEKKGLTINSKKTECVVINKGNRPRCKL